MNYIWILKVRHSGEEDDVFLFASREQAEDAVMDGYFADRITYKGNSIEEFSELLMDQDIGYFDIFSHIDPLYELREAV